MILIIDFLCVDLESPMVSVLSCGYIYFNEPWLHLPGKQNPNASNSSKRSQKILKCIVFQTLFCDNEQFKKAFLGIKPVLTEVRHVNSLHRYTRLQYRYQPLLLWKRW